MEARKGIKNPADWLEDTIKDFINKSPENMLQNRENEKALTPIPSPFHVEASLDFPKIQAHRYVFQILHRSTKFK